MSHAMPAGKVAMLAHSQAVTACYLYNAVLLRRDGAKCALNRGHLYEQPMTSQPGVLCLKVKCWQISALADQHGCECCYAYAADLLLDAICPGPRSGVKHVELANMPCCHNTALLNE